MNGNPKNSDWLIAEGIIDDKNLTQAGRDALDNAAPLTQDEIDALKSVKQKFNLDPIPLEEPSMPQIFHIWHL